MRRALTVFLGAIAGLLPACSLLFASDLSDADGTTTVIVVEKEGGSSAATPDARSSTTTDAPSPGVDGGPGSGPFCQSLSPAPKFCEDFENVSDLRDRWSVRTFRDVPIVVSSTDGFESSHSVFVPLKKSEGCSYARLEKGVTNLAGTRLEVRVRFKTIVSAALNSPFQVSFDDDGTPCGVILYSDSDHTATNMQSNEKPNEIYNLPKEAIARPNEWNELIFQATQTEAGLKLKTSLNGGSSEHTYPQCKIGTKAGFAVGFHCVRGDWEASYDNVVADYD